ncbi:MAG: trimethylamine methyltransferase family protein, partial [Gammaproteobacteria bacterium]|nr:trimethylamine methyltransferase family protein [Gammaproteobacteria bacterium]
TAFYDFGLADNNSYEQWSAEGGRDQLERAQRRWQALLESYQPPELPAAADEALKEFMARRKRELPETT